MASDAKPASPAPEDPPADEPMDSADPEDKPEAEPEPEDEGGEEQDDEEGQEEEEPPKKRGGRRKRQPAPATPTLERPSRERKTVERYAELTPRSTPSKKSAAILQGSGTKLKEIPNVSFKLSKRKIDENLQSLHTIMFGRKSNVHYLKRNIAQFSGFVWTDNEDKQRSRVKEKLDKIKKEKLLDFCEILDVPAKATSRKEEVSAKLLEFLESPCITRDVVLSDVKKGKKRQRNIKGSGKATEGASAEKKRKSQKQADEADNENDDEDDAGPADSEDAPIGEDDEDSEVKEDSESDEEPDETPAKKTSKDDTQGKKEVGSKSKENDVLRKKTPMKSKQDSELESKKAGKKASKSTRKESSVSVDKANKVSKSKKDVAKESQSSNSGALNNKARKKPGAKASSETKGKGKGRTDAGSAPTTKQLHAVVSDILKEVDFNTATLADILRKLGAHFKMDLMDRKSEVKHIIEEVINSMSDDEGEEENDEDDAENNGKTENSKEDPDGGEEK